MNIVGLEVERICFNCVISVHTLHLNREFTRWGGSFMGRNYTAPSLFEVDPTDNNLRIYSKFSFLPIKLFLLSHCHESISRSLLLLYRRNSPPALQSNWTSRGRAHYSTSAPFPHHLPWLWRPNSRRLQLLFHMSQDMSCTGRLTGRRGGPRGQVYCYEPSAPRQKTISNWEMALITANLTSPSLVVLYVIVFMFECPSGSTARS